MTRYGSNRRITPDEDVLDSRDIITRIKELDDEREEFASDDGGDPDGRAPRGHRERLEAEWDATLDGQELWALKQLADEACSSPDWRHGEALIRDTFFTEWAQQIAEESGEIDFLKLQWPLTCIDWNQAAQELKHDYMAVEFYDRTYYIRS